MRYLLIDLSYFVFYRYYAIVNYIKLSTKLSPNLVNIREDEQFINKFEEMFEKTVLKLVKTHYGIKNLNCCTNLQIIFVKDCSRSDIWRLEFFPKYKANRDHSKKKDNFDSYIFEYVYKTILPKLMSKYYCLHEFFVDNSEADDCIAIITECLKDKSNDEVIIITNDNDYLQLMDNVDSIYNLQGKDLRFKMIDGCPKKSLLCKILMGDPSDNIKGVLSKSKTLKLLSNTDNDNDNQDLCAMMMNNFTEQQKKTFEFNKHMIDFAYIPQHLKDAITHTFQSHTFINSDLCFCKSSTFV